MLVNGTHYRTIWREGQLVRMIDQLTLPFQFKIFDAPDHRATAGAIRDMVTRGAGAIGAAGGFGMAQAGMEAPQSSDGFAAFIDAAAALLKGTRPTAQNLFYAVDRVHAAARAALPDVARARAAACAAADAVADEDVESGVGSVGRPPAGEDLPDLLVGLDVAGLHERRSDRLGEGSDASLDEALHGAEADRRALGVERLGDPPGDRMVVGHPEDQRAPILEQSHGSSATSCWRAERRPPERTVPSRR